jgi:hypothetical protein
LAVPFANAPQKAQDFMNLKEHPALRILSTWPPVGVHTRSDKLCGEVAIFTGSELNTAMPTAIF